MWGVALVLGVTAIASSCGRETIDLARTTDQQSRPDGGGATKSDGGQTTVSDAGPCTSNCKALGGVCVPSTGKCGECNTAADCSDIFSAACNTQTHECVMCRSNDDCQSLKQKLGAINFFGLPAPALPDLPVACDTTISRCGFACESGCPCDADKGVCIQCTAGECAGANLKCLDGACVVCRNDDDCADGTHCQLSTHNCVECFDTAHCQPGVECDLRFHRCASRI
jgi:hypothetical protein